MYGDFFILIEKNHYPVGTAKIVYRPHCELWCVYKEKNKLPLTVEHFRINHVGNAVDSQSLYTADEL